MVIGAGPIGCEMAQAFRRLGADVTLIERERRLLPRDEAQASRVLARVFEAEGVNLHLGVTVERVWQDGDLVVAGDRAVTGDIHVAAGGAELKGDVLLLSVGRRPNVDGLDLDKAGVVYGNSGIQVDGNARTSQRHIYAAGDCTGGHQFTHYAGWQGFLAARNALLPGASVCVAEQVPWTTFTDPEVAHVGLGEDEARARFGDDVKTCEWPMAQVDRARTEGDTGGFMKLVHTKGGTLLGATIVAARAGEMIHEFILAMDKGIKVGDLANTIHVYPTYSTAGMQAAAQIRVEQLLSGTSGKVIRRLARLMG
jgi:pyruvate/2-oxoglutarate dehydrogenase complex dihydrolipoamide dehydrogenase (E3) component